MKKNKIIMSALTIALIGAGVTSYVVLQPQNYKKAIDTCVSRFMTDYPDGKKDAYKEYCECFVSAPKKVMPKEAYNEWLEVYIKDKEAARDMSLDKRFNFQPQFECMMEKGPFEIWAETAWRLYRDMDGLSEEDATCVIAKFLTTTDEKTFINFAKMKLLEQAGEEEGMESFKFAETRVKESCIVCNNLPAILEDVKDINKKIKNPLNDKHELPIMVAIKYQCDIDDILKLKPNLNSATKDVDVDAEMSPLMWAAIVQHEETMQKLLEHGAKIDYQENESGYTALMYAAQFNKPKSVRFLLENGANYNLTSKDGSMPLTLAMQEGNEEIVEMLLEKGAKANLKLLDPAGYDFLTVLADRGHVKMVELAIKMGADVNEQNVPTKRTALMIAILSGEEEVVKVLLENGADPNIVDKNLYSPLMVAALNGNYEQVKLLLEHGAKKDLKNSDGRTAIELARDEVEGKDKEKIAKVIELLK